MKTAGWYCGKDHYELLHNTGTEYCCAQVGNNKSLDTPWESKIPGKYQCPLCKGNHTYAWQSGPVFSSGRLTSCPMFANAGPDQKCEVICTFEGCRLCTGWSHNSTKCSMHNKRQCGATTAEAACCKWLQCSLHMTRLDRGMIKDNTTTSHSIQKEAADSCSVSGSGSEHGCAQDSRETGGSKANVQA